MDFYRHHILWEGGFRSCDLDGIFKRMNRTPQRNLGWAFSIDMTRELLANDGAMPREPGKTQEDDMIPIPRPTRRPGWN